MHDFLRIDCDDRVGLFIDAPSFYPMIRAIDLNVDYGKLRSLFTKDFRLVKAFYFATLIYTTNNHCSVLPLVDWLDFNGYTTVTSTVYLRDDSDRPRTKHHIVDLTVRAMALFDSIDHYVIISNDGDLSSLVRELSLRGKTVTVIGSMRGSSTSPYVADELRRAADDFVDIKTMAEYIAAPAKIRKSDVVETVEESDEEFDDE